MKEIELHLNIYGEKALHLVQSALDRSRNFSRWNVKSAPDTEVIYALSESEQEEMTSTDAVKMIAASLEQHARWSVNKWGGVEWPDVSLMIAELKRLSRCIKGKEQDVNKLTLSPIDISAIQTLETELESLEKQRENEISEVNDKYDRLVAEVQEKIDTLRNVQM